MKHIVCSVFDSAAEVHMKPFVVRSDAEGERLFGDLVRDKGTVFGQHPEHFALNRIGVFDDSTSELTDESPQLIALASDLVPKADVVVLDEDGYPAGEFENG